MYGTAKAATPRATATTEIVALRKRSTASQYPARYAIAARSSA
jgi:hypothetical protein